MGRTAEAIIDDVLALPERERARVLDALVDMIGAPPAPSPEILRERRDELETESVEGVPGTDVVRDLRGE